MTSYAPVGQLTGIFSRPVNITDRIPWVYVIASLRSRLIFVGESHHEGGLLAEVSGQLAATSGSVLYTKSVELGVSQPESPYVVVAARLPSNKDPAGFDGASNTIRLQCAITLQMKLVELFIPNNPGWTDVSMISGLPATPGSAVADACNSILIHVQSSIQSMSAFSRSVPLHLVLLDPYPVAAHETESLEAALTEIELTLHDYVIGQLKTAHPGNWWPQIPLSVRTDCVQRREQDGGNHEISADAYMMFIDFIDIAKANWGLIGPLMERVAGKQGKDAATSWIKDLNQIRKVWAHPIRGKYTPLERGTNEKVFDIRRKLLTACQQLSVGSSK